MAKPVDCSESADVLRRENWYIPAPWDVGAMDAPGSSIGPRRGGDPSKARRSVPLIGMASGLHWCRSPGASGPLVEENHDSGEPLRRGGR